MKKIILVFLMIMPVLFGWTEEKYTMAKIRNDFYKAIESEYELNKLFDYITREFGSDEEKFPVKVLAYYGALEAVSAQYTYNPYTKAKNVYSGLKKLDKAVKEKPDDLEVRFLRFSVLDHLPGVFGLGSDREKDMQKVYLLLIQKDYSELSRDIQKGLANYLLKSSRLEKWQEDELKKIYQGN